MKKIMWCGVLILAVSALPACQSGRAVSDSEAVKITAGQVVEQKKLITAAQAAEGMGKGFNLGQMFESTQHEGSLANAKPKIDAYYERGFRVVRIPITWTEQTAGVTLADPDTGVINRDLARLKDLTEVIDYVLSKPNLYVIINAHHEKALKDHNKAAVLEQLWADINDLYKDREYRLIFQFLNEPHLSNLDAMEPEYLRKMTELAYNKIRAVDPYRILVIGGNQWFAADEMAVVWPNIDQVGGGEDRYLMATFHHYNPWTFNGDNQGDYADEWTNADLSDPMDNMLAWQKNIGKGMPMYIGEWGTGWQSRFQEMNCNNIRLWYSQFHTQYAAPRGIPTIVWDDGGWFKVFNHATQTFDNNLIDCISGTCAWDGKERFNEGCK